MWALSPLILTTASSPRSFTKETCSSSHKVSFTSSEMWEQQRQWPLLHWVARTQAWSPLQRQCLDQSQQYQLMFSQRPSKWTRMWLSIFNLSSRLTTTTTRRTHHADPATHYNTIIDCLNMQPSSFAYPFEIIICNCHHSYPIFKVHFLFFIFKYKRKSLKIWG